MKNSVDQGGCYPQRPKAEVDNTLRDLQHFSYPAKAEFNNCFIISYSTNMVSVRVFFLGGRGGGAFGFFKILF